MNPSAQHPVLRVSSLSRNFGGLRALNDVDLDIRAGEIVALIGPNGAGKTTFFNCVTGIYVPTEGEVYACRPGMEKPVRLNGMKPFRITELGLARTFQNIRLFSSMTVLENVMNPTNVGAIFRCAAALGMDAVLLTTAGSDPLYRRASRVSMGNVFLIPWTYLPENGDWTQLLRDLGFRTVAMALRNDSVRLDDPRLAAEEKLAIVMGTEGDGLASSTIASCDYTVRIPMYHGVDSLNVAAASAVAFYELGLPPLNEKED